MIYAMSNPLDQLQPGFRHDIWHMLPKAHGYAGRLEHRHNCRLIANYSGQSSPRVKTTEMRLVRFSLVPWVVKLAPPLPQELGLFLA